MDNQIDGPRFRELMDQLHAALKEGFKANDALSDAYWKALRDVPFAEVKANVERIIATAKRDTPFPRPASLRNSPAPVSTSGLPSVAQLRAERLSVKHWRELKDRDPLTFEIEWRAARAFTSMAQCDEGTPEHREWTRQYQQWGRLRYASRDEQQEAAHTYLGRSIEMRNGAGDASCLDEGVDPP